ncbi:hypothetical protein LCGC14_2460260, partial [marine sediment metagenome]
MARKTTAEVVIKGTDQASPAMRSAASSAKSMGTTVGETAGQAQKAESGFKKFTAVLKSKLGAFSSVSSSAKGMGTAVGGTAGQAQKAQSGFARFTASLKSKLGVFSSVSSSAKSMGTAVGETSDQTKKAQSGFTKFTAFLKSRFVITLGDVARGVSTIFGAIKDASDLSSQTNALKLQLARQGKDFNTYIAKLKQVSRGTVSTADLIKSSSKALLLGIPANEIVKLLDIARASAIATGQSVTSAFNDIATGIGRSSPLILDNLGIIVKIGKANDAYAKTLKKTASELTATEQKQALLNVVLEVGEERIRLFGESADKTAIALQKGQAALEDFKNVAGRTTSLITT